MTESGLAERYLEVQARIASAAGSAGRSADEIKLIVVTKFHPAQLVLDLLELGHGDFGENRDQEAKGKAAEVELLLQDRPLPSHSSQSLPSGGALPQPRWHFIGQLQSNKVKSVLGYSNIIHSLDRPSLLQELAKQASRRQEELGAEPVEVFIELNLTDDPGRGGLDPASLLDFADAVALSPALRLLGVMGVASLDQPPERDFERLRQSADLLRASHPGAKYLSMGMSGDYESAISYGATHLRIGSAITGNRA